MSAALILFAHGSRDPQWAAPFRAIQQRVARAKPEVAVELAFLEIMQPSLGDAVARLAASGRTRFTVAPLFMAQGAHLRRDLAALVADVRTRHSGVDIEVLPPAGEAEAVLDAITAWVCTHV